MIFTLAGRTPREARHRALRAVADRGARQELKRHKANGPGESRADSDHDYQEEPVTTETKATELADGLRAVADMIEANPELAHILRYALTHLSEPLDDRDQMITLARIGARTTGKVTKDFTGKHASVRIAFGPVSVTGYIDREQVCERVVVGHETVIEAGPDPDAVAALPVVEREVEREIVEWRCHPLLADERETVSA